MGQLRRGELENDEFCMGEELKDFFKKIFIGGFLLGATSWLHAVDIVDASIYVEKAKKHLKDYARTLNSPAVASQMSSPRVRQRIFSLYQNAIDQHLSPSIAQYEYELDRKWGFLKKMITQARDDDPKFSKCFESKESTSNFLGLLSELSQHASMMKDFMQEAELNESFQRHRVFDFNFQAKAEELMQITQDDEGFLRAIKSCCQKSQKNKLCQDKSLPEKLEDLTRDYHVNAVPSNVIHYLTPMHSGLNMTVDELAYLSMDSRYAQRMASAKSFQEERMVLSDAMTNCRHDEESRIQDIAKSATKENWIAKIGNALRCSAPAVAQVYANGKTQDILLAVAQANIEVTSQKTLRKFSAQCPADTLQHYQNTMSREARHKKTYDSLANFLAEPVSSKNQMTHVLPPPLQVTHNPDGSSQYLMYDPNGRPNGAVVIPSSASVATLANSNTQKREELLKNNSEYQKLLGAAENERGQSVRVLNSPTRSLNSPSQYRGLAKRRTATESMASIPLKGQAMHRLPKVVQGLRKRVSMINGGRNSFRNVVALEKQVNGVGERLASAAQARSGQSAQAVAQKRIRQGKMMGNKIRQLDAMAAAGVSAKDLLKSINKNNPRAPSAINGNQVPSGRVPAGSVTSAQNQKRLREIEDEVDAELLREYEKQKETLKNSAENVKNRVNGLYEQLKRASALKNKKIEEIEADYNIERLTEKFKDYSLKKRNQSILTTHKEYNIAKRERDQAASQEAQLRNQILFEQRNLNNLAAIYKQLPNLGNGGLAGAQTPMQQGPQWGPGPMQNPMPNQSLTPGSVPYAAPGIQIKNAANSYHRFNLFDSFYLHATMSAPKDVILFGTDYDSVRLYEKKLTTHIEQLSKEILLEKKALLELFREARSGAELSFLSIDELQEMNMIQETIVEELGDLIDKKKNEKLDQVMPEIVFTKVLKVYNDAKELDSSLRAEIQFQSDVLLATGKNTSLRGWMERVPSLLR